MSAEASRVAIAFGLYVVLVLGVGVAATRRSSRSPEEYFLAGRGLGTLILFMALFGTNATAFVLVGIPGLAYHHGVGVFGLNAAIVALGIPITFWVIGSPARGMAKRLGALTPAELYARRFGSRWTGWLLFAFFSIYTLPYMVTAVQGAAVTLEKTTGLDGVLGGAIVLVVALIYTSLGGMRATAWTNVLQGSLFLAFMIAAFFVIPASIGGFEKATADVRAHDPGLLVRQDSPLFTPQAWSSWGLAISLCVIAFPHMLVRFFAAESDEALRTISRLYPVALICLWLPAVMIGVWGAGQFPGLVGKESDAIFGLMVTNHLPAWLGTCGFLAVLAAVMSTLDAQLLTLSSMLTRDVLDSARGGHATAERDVRSGRLFAALVAAIVFTLWRQLGASIFDIATLAFSGYVTLVPTLLCGVRWRRFNPTGAWCSILGGNLVFGWCVWEGGGVAAAREASYLGMLPVFWGLVAASLLAWLGALAAPPPDPVRTREAFGDDG